MSAEVLKHYNQEVSFFKGFLDKKMKYTSGFFKSGSETLDESINNMLDLHLNWGQVTSKTRILDVGCGWGSMLHHLRESGLSSEYVGVTPSVCQRDSILLAVYQNAEICLGLAEDNWDRFAPESFDLILFSGSICHLKDKTLALKNARKLLKPEGIILVEDTFFISEEVFELHKNHPATKFVQNDIFGFAEITSLSRFFEQVADTKMKIIQSLEHSDSYARTIEKWISNLDNKCKIEYPQTADFIKYMSIANKGWNRTTVNYLHKIMKL